MLNVICRRNFCDVSKLHLLQFHLCSSLSISTPGYNLENGNGNGNPFAVNYLSERLGFSRECALKAYKVAKFKSSANPDLVLAFLDEHGLSDTQIKSLIKVFPQILALKPQGNLLRKIEFLRSLGMSRDDIVKIIMVAGNFMARSLENRIIPNFNYMKDMLKSEKDAIDVIKRFPRLLYMDLQKTLRPNVDTLLDAGVLEVNVWRLFKYSPGTLSMGHDVSKAHVKRIAEMGINPESVTFVVGFGVMKSFTKSSWNKKLDVYKRWGYLEDHMLVAFRRHPQCMAKSEDKIDAVLDYIINTMGCDPAIFITFPKMVSLSLKRTIIPRCSVYQVLKSKGLLKSASIVGFLRYSKRSFLDKFVLPFVDEVPELLELYPCD
ncbi:hypothetical protein F511_18763 [Dorcoceras hygrometricum]|uniref:Mitochondrial transcription termination factor family protein n=1 Tax=Dorcoceras hygrometricum TaxID=472368 RepID=A0A2Z7D9W3_9LAMI|nr:hypothetical protein F511_18763 [Dorcoceras hygrometricum]